MAKPKQPDTKTTVTIRLSTELKDKLERLAESEDRSMSAQIERFLRRALEENKDA